MTNINFNPNRFGVIDPFQDPEVPSEVPSEVPRVLERIPFVTPEGEPCTLSEEAERQERSDLDLEQSLRVFHSDNPEIIAVHNRLKALHREFFDCYVDAIIAINQVEGDVSDYVVDKKEALETILSQISETIQTIPTDEIHMLFPYQYSLRKYEEAIESLAHIDAASLAQRELAPIPVAPVAANGQLLPGLPDEVSYSMACFIPFQDLVNMSSVNSSWHQMAQSFSLTFELAHLHGIKNLSCRIQDALGPGIFPMPHEFYSQMRPCRSLHDIHRNQERANLISTRALIPLFKRSIIPSPLNPLGKMALDEVWAYQFSNECPELMEKEVIGCMEIAKKLPYVRLTEDFKGDMRVKAWALSLGIRAHLGEVCAVVNTIVDRIVRAETVRVVIRSLLVRDPNQAWYMVGSSNLLIENPQAALEIAQSIPDTYETVKVRALAAARAAADEESKDNS